MTDDAIHVRVFSDYSAATPVWQDGLVTDLEEFGVSAALAEQLLELQRLWDDFVDWERGWRSKEAEMRYFQLQDELVLLLQQELGPRFKVTKD